MFTFWRLFILAQPVTDTTACQVRKVFFAFGSSPLGLFGFSSALPKKTQRNERIPKVRPLWCPPGEPKGDFTTKFSPIPGIVVPCRP